MGYDGFVTQGMTMKHNTPTQMWKGSILRPGLRDGGASRIIVINRSGMIYDDRPSHYGDWEAKLDSIKYPDGTTANRPNARWH